MIVFSLLTGKVRIETIIGNKRQKDKQFLEIISERTGLRID